MSVSACSRRFSPFIVVVILSLAYIPHLVSSFRPHDDPSDGAGGAHVTGPDPRAVGASSQSLQTSESHQSPLERHARATQTPTAVTVTLKKDDYLLDVIAAAVNRTANATSIALTIRGATGVTSVGLASPALIALYGDDCVPFSSSSLVKTVTFDGKAVTVNFAAGACVRIPGRIQIAVKNASFSGAGVTDGGNGQYAVSVSPGTNFTCDSCRFYDHPFGAIECTDGNVTLASCVFRGNDNDYQGADILARGASLVRVSKCTFMGRSRGVVSIPVRQLQPLARDAESDAVSADGGTFVTPEDGPPSWSLSSIPGVGRCDGKGTSSEGRTAGGCIALRDTSSGFVADCAFDGDIDYRVAWCDGGAIGVLDRASVVVRNVSAVSTLAVDYGGFISVRHNASAVVIGLTAQYSSSGTRYNPGFGGIVHVAEGASMSIQQSSMYDSAATQGGVAYVSDMAVFNMSGCTVDATTARPVGLGTTEALGAFLFMSDSASANMEASRIANAWAKSGSGGFVHIEAYADWNFMERAHTRLTVHNCTVLNAVALYGALINVAPASMRLSGSSTFFDDVDLSGRAVTLSIFDSLIVSTVTMLSAAIRLESMFARLLLDVRLDNSNHPDAVRSSMAARMPTNALVIERTTFKNVSSGRLGGLLFMDGTARVTVRNCTLSTVTVDVQFTDNIQYVSPGKARGGVAYLLHAASLAVTDTVIAATRAADGGGLVAIAAPCGASAHFLSCTVTNTSSAADGGAVHIDRSVFPSSTQRLGDNGGAEAAVTLEGSHVSASTSGGRGGLAYVAANLGRVLVINTTVLKSEAVASGGVVHTSAYTENAFVTDGAVFGTCVAGDAGGFLYAEAANLTHVTRAAIRIKRTKLGSVRAASGGLFFLTRTAIAIVENVTIEKSSANTLAGLAVLTGRSELRASNLTVVDASCTLGSGGVAVRGNSSIDLDIDSVSFGTCSSAPGLACVSASTNSNPCNGTGTSGSLLCANIAPPLPDASWGSPQAVEWRCRIAAYNPISAEAGIDAYVSGFESGAEQPASCTHVLPSAPDTVAHVGRAGGLMAAVDAVGEYGEVVAVFVTQPPSTEYELDGVLVLPSVHIFSPDSEQATVLPATGHETTAGVVVSSLSHVVLEGLKFQSFRGDALKVEAGAHVTIMGCLFTENAGRSLVVEGHVMLSSSSFTGNTATAVTVVGGGVVECDACSFQRNVNIDANGGAVYASGLSLVRLLNTALVERCFAFAGMGGFVYATGSAVVEMTGYVPGVSRSAGVGAAYGGFVAAEGASADGPHVEISEISDIDVPYASIGGACFYAKGAAAITVSGPLAISNAYGVTGGVALLDGGSSMTMDRVYVTNVNADRGGFLGVMTGFSIGDNGRFYVRLQSIGVSRTASRFEGGAMYVSGLGQLSVAGCQFYDTYSAFSDGGVLAARAPYNDDSVILPEAYLWSLVPDPWSDVDDVLERIVMPVTGPLSIDFTDCVVMEARAGGSGGVFFFSHNVHALLFNIAIRTVRAEQSGGALAFTGLRVHLVLDSIDVVTATAKADGGVFYFGGASAESPTDTNRVVVSNLYVDACGASSGGMMYAAATTTVNISDFRLSSTAATVDGGAILIEEQAYVTLTRMNVSDSSAHFQGGVICARGQSSVSLSNCTATHVTAGEAGYGGFAAVTGGASLEVDGLHVTGASAAYGGSFYASDCAAVHGERMMVSESSVGGDGGMGYVSGGAGIILDNIAFRNTAAGGSGGVATVSDKGVLVVRRGNIKNARAGLGGSFYGDADSLVTLSHLDVEESYSTMHGGFAYVSGSSSLHMTSLRGHHFAAGWVDAEQHSVSASAAAVDNKYAAGGFIGVAFNSPNIMCRSPRGRCTDEWSPLGSSDALISDAVADPCGRLVIRGVRLADCVAPRGPIAFAWMQAKLAGDGLRVADIQVLPSINMSVTAQFGEDVKRGASQNDVLGSLFVSPPARLVFADTQAETGAGARQSRQTIAVKSGHRLGPITVSVYDAYGKQYSVPSTETLVIRLSSSPDAVVGAGITANLTNAAASAPITWLGGDLVKTFIDASNVTFSDLRAYSVGIGTFNFSFVRGKGSYEGAEWDDLFGSALLTVRVDPCSGDEQLDANTECVAAPLSASSSGTSSGLVAAAVVPVILVSVAFVVTCRWWYQRLRKAKSKATHKEFLKHVMSKKEHLLALEIPAETVELLDVIGSGEFGLVHKAQVFSDGRLRLCAVKIMRNNASVDERSSFLQEAEIMIGLSHPNVVSLINISTQAEPMMILLELVPHGNLRRFVQRVTAVHRGTHSSISLLVGLCAQVARGMAYLSASGIIHRDLAARNVLIGQDAWGEMVAKVSDFGLSREGSDYYRRVGRKAKLPVKWMSPEAISKRLWSEKSDVYAFGITLWEVFTYGDTPFAELSNGEAYRRIQTGYRMDPPRHCPPDVALLMASCWQLEPEQRPRLVEMSAQLDAFFLEMQMANADIVDRMVLSHNSGGGDAIFAETDSGIPRMAAVSGYANVEGVELLEVSSGAASLSVRASGGTHRLSVSASGGAHRLSVSASGGAHRLSVGGGGHRGYLTLRRGDNTSGSKELSPSQARSLTSLASVTAAGGGPHEPHVTVAGNEVRVTSPAITDDDRCGASAGRSPSAPLRDLSLNATLLDSQLHVEAEMQSQAHHLAAQSPSAGATRFTGAGSGVDQAQGVAHVNGMPSYEVGIEPNGYIDA